MVAICGVLILSLLLAAAWYFPRGDFLSVSEVCRRWGERTLDVAAFRSAEGDEFPRRTGPGVGAGLLYWAATSTNITAT